MVKKIIFVITDTYGEQRYTVPFLLKKNEELSSMITLYKNKITSYHATKLWDKFKKLSNEYELIFTTPNTGQNISEYIPVSRSFFKLWEILHDFNVEIFESSISSPIKCLFLAEGPGGFAEAFIKYREDTYGSVANDDEYHGITLKSFNDKNVPEWKVHKECMKRMKINYGEDKTGNIYNVKNLLYLVKSFGRNSLDFITADGGFDFSSDFNGQEEQSFRLILSEIYAALLLQKHNGTFILKVFDMFHENTLKIFQILKQFYEFIYITKPLTSRPANSEKYLVCIKFRGCNKDCDEIGELLDNYSEENCKKFFDKISFDVDMLSSLVNYNTYYTLRQIYYIERTIKYINVYSNKSSDNSINTILTHHAVKSKKWCEKYNLISKV